MSLTEPQKLWIAALRSGEYKQTCGFLTDTRGHCCLGVACKVAMANGVSLETEERIINGEPAVVYGGFFTEAPPAVVEWLGLRSNEGDLEDAFLDGDECLTYANDRGVPFKQIADFIEANPEAVFVQPT